MQMLSTCYFHTQQQLGALLKHRPPIKDKQEFFLGGGRIFWPTIFILREKKIIERKELEAKHCPRHTGPWHHP